MTLTAFIILVVIAILGTAFGQHLYDGIRAVWAKRERLTGWPARRREKAAEVEGQRKLEELKALRGEVLKIARSSGPAVAVDAVGRNPRRVTFSDGTQSYYYDNFREYAEDMYGNQVPPTRTWHLPAPPVLDRWTRKQCEDWLTEHRS